MEYTLSVLFAPTSLKLHWHFKILRNGPDGWRSRLIQPIVLRNGTFTGLPGNNPFTINWGASGTGTLKYNPAWRWSAGYYGTEKIVHFTPFPQGISVGKEAEIKLELELPSI